MEQPRQACSGQPNTPGSKKARYTISCLRPSNRSSRLTLPLGPSNSYFFSTAIHGIRRRSAARASRDLVKAFSFTSICWRAASHSCCDTIEGVFIAIPPFVGSLLVSSHYWLTSKMLLSFGSAMTYLVLFFFREIFTANAASPPVDTEPATINPTVDKQNGHIVHLSG